MNIFVAALSCYTNWMPTLPWDSSTQQAVCNVFTYMHVRMYFAIPQ